MLLSNRHRFLFVHIAKTGGTSVRSALGRLAWRDPLQIAAYICHRLSHATGHRIGTKLPRHAAAVAAKEMLTPAHFDSLFKFSFVRNPWDRLVSAYCHFQREQDSLLGSLNIRTFPEFAKWMVEDSIDYRGRKHVFVAAIRRTQIEHLTDLDGVRIVDFVGRYERLPEDFRTVCTRLNVPLRDLPHKRNSRRKGDLRWHYDDATAELIGHCYREDVASFGYGFNTPILAAA